MNQSDVMVGELCDWLIQCVESSIRELIVITKGLFDCSENNVYVVGVELT